MHVFYNEQLIKEHIIPSKGYRKTDPKDFPENLQAAVDRCLSLTGMADTLELRLLEAQNNGLAFSEFLSMLLTDELQTRANRKCERLLQHAHADSTKTLENFDFSFDPSINNLHNS
ncbi:MAG: ATP-binding protein [Bacteroidetes bacterium]|nr:ATP-binding protein [Bacteroidota bacterium]MCL5737635.1 ATP-binding protein [Bacteroidota bacterium]